MWKTRAKKWTALIATVSLLQTNIVWCGVPTLPIPAFFHSSPVFVFHSAGSQFETRPLDPFEPKIPDTRTGDRNAEKAAPESRRPASHASEVRHQGLREALRDPASDRSLEKLTLADVPTLPGVSAQQMGQLREQFGADATVKVFNAGDGQSVIRVEGKGKAANILFSAGAPTQISTAAPVTPAESPVAPPADADKPGPEARHVAPVAPAAPAATKLEPSKIQAAERGLDGKIINVSGQKVRLSYDNASNQLIGYDLRGARITADTKIFTGTMADAAGRQSTVVYGAHHFELTADGTLIVKGSARVELGRDFRDGNTNQPPGAAADSGRNPAGPAAHDLAVNVDSSGQVFYQATSQNNAVTFTAAVTPQGVDFGKATFEPITADSSNITLMQGGAQIAKAGALGQFGSGADTFRFSTWQVAGSPNQAGKAILSHFNISAGSSALLNAGGQTVGRVSLDDTAKPQQVIVNGTEAGLAAGAALARSPDMRAASIPVGVTGAQGQAVVFLSDKVATKDDVRAAVAVAGKLENLSFSTTARPDIEKAITAAVDGQPSVARYETMVTVKLDGETHAVRVTGTGADASGQRSTPIMISDNARVNDALSLAHADNVRVPQTIGGRAIVITTDKATGKLIPTDGKGNRITDAVFQVSTKKVNGEPIQLSYRIDSFELAGNGQFVAHAIADVPEHTELFDGTLEAPASPGVASAAPMEVTASRHLDVTVQDDNRIRFAANAPGARVAFLAPVGAADIETSKISFQPVGLGGEGIKVMRAGGTLLAASAAAPDITGASGAAYRNVTWTVTTADATKPRDTQILQHFGIQHNAGTIANADGIVVGRSMQGDDGSRLLTFQHNPKADAAIKDIYFDRKEAFAPKEGQPVTQVAWAGAQAAITLNAASTMDVSQASLEKMDAFKLDGNTTQAQVDAAFKDVVSKDKGIASYDVTVAAAGGAVRIFGQGASADGEIRHPEIVTANPAFDRLAVRRVENLSELGIPIKGAQIQGGDITYRIDAQTGQRRLNVSGSEIRFRNDNGIAGVVKLENGVPQSIGLYGGKAGAAVEFAASGSLPERRMWVPQGLRVEISLKDGAISATRGDKPVPLDGVRIRFHDGTADSKNDGVLIFRQSTKNPGNTVIDIQGGIRTFAGTINGGAFTGALVDGKVQFKAKDPNGNPLVLKQPIAMPDAKGAVAKGSMLGNAHVVQVDMNLGTGVVTAEGRSFINGKQTVWVPDLAPPPNGRTPGKAPAPNPEGSDSRNLLISRYADGHRVTGRGAGGGWLNVTLNAPEKPGGPIRAFANPITSRSEHIEIGEGGAVLGGKTYSAGVGINKTSDADYHYTAMKPGVTVESGEGESKVKVTILKAGATAVYEKGELQLRNSKAHPDVAADLEHVSVDLAGIGFTFKRDGDTVKPMRHKAEGNLTIFGAGLDAMDLESTSGRIVDGRIMFDVKDDKTVRVNRSVTLLGHKDTRDRDVAIKEIGFNPANGGKMAVARVRIYEDDELSTKDPTPAKGRREKNPDRSEHNSARTSSVNLGIETRGGRTYVTGLGDSSYVHATLVENGKGNHALDAREVVFSDHAKNLQVVGGGATIMGLHMEAGLSVNTGIVSRGEFSVNGSALAQGDRADIKLGGTARVTLERGSMLSFNNGRPQFSSSKGTVVLRQLAPAMRVSGLTVVGGLRDAVTTYQNGRMASRHIPTYTYANRTGHAIPWRGMQISAGTVFTPGKGGLNIHSGSIYKVMSVPGFPGIHQIASWGPGSSKAHVSFRNSNGQVVDMRALVAARNARGPEVGSYTLRTKAGPVAGHIVQRGSERIFIPNSGIKAHEKLTYTEMAYRGGAFVPSRGFTTTDGRDRRHFGIAKDGVRFDNAGDFRLLDNRVAVRKTGTGTRQDIQTVLNPANLGKPAIVFSNHEVYQATVVHVPVGVATLRVGIGSEARRLSLPSVVLGAQRGGGMVMLTSDHYALKPASSGGAYTLGNEIPTPAEAGFVVRAGSVLGGKDGAPTFVEAAIRIDRGMPGWTIGTMTNIPIARPTASGEKGTGGEQPPALSPDKIHFTTGANGEMTITKGNLLVYNDRVGLSPDAVLIHDGISFADLHSIGVINPTAKTPDTGAWMPARISMRSTAEDMSKDVFEQVNGTTVKKGDLGINGGDPLMIAVLDRGGRRVGDVRSDSHVEVTYVSAGEGGVSAPIETGNVYLSGGETSFTRALPHDKPVEVRGADGKVTTVVHKEGGSFGYTDDGNGGVRPVDRSTSEREMGSFTFHVMVNGRRVDETTSGRLVQTHMTSTDADGKPTDVVTSQFVTKDGRTINLTQVYDMIAADGTVPDDRKKEAVGIRDTLNSHVLEAITTGRVSGVRPGREMDSIIHDRESTVSSYGFKNDVHWGVTDFYVAAQFGAPAYYSHFVGGPGNFDDVTKYMPAYAEIDAQNNPARAAVGRLQANPLDAGVKGDGASGAYIESKDTGAPVWRSIDKFAGNMLGLERWMNADKVYYIPLIALEQGFNFMTLGGAGLLKGTVGAAKVAVAVEKGAEVTLALERAGELAVAAERTAEAANVAGRTVEGAQTVGTAGRLWNAGKTVVAKGAMVYMRHEAFGKTYGAADSWAENGLAGFTNGQTLGKTADAAFSVALSEFPIIAPAIGGKLLGQAGKAEKAAEWLGFGKAAANGAREGEVAWKQYATVAALGGTASLTYDALTGNVHNGVDVVDSFGKGAAAGTAGLGAFRLTAGLSQIPFVKNLRYMSVGAVGALAYNGLGNVAGGRGFFDHWQQSVGQGAFIGFFGGRSLKAVQNLPTVAAGQGEARGLRGDISMSYLNAYTLDRVAAGAGLATTSVVMRLLEPIYSRLPGMSQAVQFLRENGMLAPEQRKDPKQGLLSSLLGEARSSFEFGMKYHPIFSFGTPGTTVTETLGLDALGSRLAESSRFSFLNPLLQYTVTGPINMQMFGLMERASPILAERAGLIRLMRDGNTGELILDHEGKVQAADPKDAGKLFALELAGKASAPASAVPFEARRLQADLNGGKPNGLLDSAALRWLTGGVRGEARDRAIILASRIQDANANGSLSPAFTINDADGKPRIIRVAPDGATPQVLRENGDALVQQARGVLALDPRIQAAALEAKPGEGHVVEIEVPGLGKRAINLDANTAQEAAVLGVRALDPKTQGAKLADIARTAPSPVVAAEAVRGLHGDEAATVFSAMRALKLDGADGIIADGLTKTAITLRPTGEMEVSAGILPTDHPLALDGREGVIVVDRGNLGVEYRTENAGVAEISVRRPGSSKIETYFEMRGPAETVGAWAAVKSLPTEVQNLIRAAAGSGELTLRVRAGEEGKADEIVSLVAGDGKAARDFTPFDAPLTESLALRKKWIADPATVDASTLQGALLADPGYRRSTNNLLSARIKILSQGREPNLIERATLRSLEKTQIRDAYRVALALEVKRSSAESVNGAGLTDGVGVRELRAALTILVNGAKASGATREGLSLLTDAHLLRETIAATTRTDGERHDKLEARMNGEEGAAGKFFSEVDRQVGGKGTSIPDLTTSVTGLLEANGFSTKEGLTDNVAHAAALDTLLASGSDAADRGAALKAMFNKESIGDLTDGQRISLFLALTSRYFQTYEKGKLKATDKTMGIGETDAKQAALLVQFMLGRIAGLSAGGGKSVVFTTGFAEFASRTDQPKGVGELIVYSPNEIAKYLTEYQPLARAMGIEFVDGRDLVNKSAKEWDGAYNPDKNAKGEEWASGKRLFKVVVTDYHSRGFAENESRSNPTGDRAALLNNVSVRAVDEADACLLSQMSFISSDGNAVASPLAVGRGRAILDASLSVLGYDKPGEVDLKTNWKVTTSGEPGYREFKAGGYTDDDLAKGLWFHVEDNGNVVVSRELMKAIIEKVGGTDQVTPREVKEVLRAVEATHNSERLVFMPDAEGKIRPTLKSAGTPQVGQIDSSTLFNVASVLLHNQREGVKGTEKLSTTEIRLSEAGSMATFVQVLQRKTEHFFGATGTPEAMEGLAERVIGVRVVNVEPSTFADYAGRSVTAVADSYSGARATGKGTGERQLNILSAPTLTTEGRAKYEAEAILLSIGDTKVNDGDGAGIVAGGSEAVHKRALVDVLIGALAQKGFSMDTTAFIEAAGNGGVSLREFVGRVNSGDLSSAFSTLTPEGLTVAADVMSRVRFIDGLDTADVVEDMVKDAGPRGSIVFVNEAGLRGLSYDAKKAKPEEGQAMQQVDLFLSGYEGFSKESWLQALARVDRKGPGARRTVVVESGVIDAHLKQAVAIDAQLKSDGRDAGLFEADARSAMTPERTLQQQLARYRENPASLTPAETLELGSEYLSRDNRARSALFFIGEQASVQLLKQPLQEMVARERLAGNSRGADYLESVYRAVLSNSDKGEAPEGAGLQDFRRIAAQSFNNSAKTAAQFLILVAKDGRAHGVSDAVIQEARLRAGDVVTAMEHVGEKLTGTPSTTGAFVEVDSTVLHESPAMRVLDVVAQLADRYLLSNTVRAEGQAQPVTVQTYVARTSASDRSGARLDDRKAVVGELAQDTATPGAATLSPAQRVGEASVSLLNFEKRGESVSTPLASIGMPPAANGQTATHKEQADYLAQFENPGRALAFGTVLSGLGITLNKEEALALVQSSNPEASLATMLVDRKVGGPVMAAAATALTDADSRAGAATYLAPKLKDGQLQSRPSLLGRARDFLFSSNQTPAEKLSTMRLAALGDATARPAAAAALYLILNPNDTAGAANVSRRVANASEPAMATATVADLATLADGSNNDAAVLARFDTAAATAPKISESPWFKPLLVAGAAIGAVGAATLGALSLLPAMPSLGGAMMAGTVVAGAFINPVLGLLTGVAPSSKMPSRDGEGKLSMSDVIPLVMTAATAVGGFLGGRALTGAFDDGIPGGLTLATMAAAAIGTVASMTELKDAGPRVKSAVSLVLALGALAIFALPGAETILNAVASPLGNVASATMESLMPAAIGGALGVGAAWALLNGPGQWLANARATADPEQRNASESTIRLSDKAKEVLSDLKEKAGEDGDVTVGDLWTAIQGDDSISAADKMKAFRFALIEHGLSDKEADQVCQHQQSDDSAAALSGFTLDDVLWAGGNLDGMMDVAAYESSWGFSDDGIGANGDESEFQIPDAIANRAADANVGVAAGPAERQAFIGLWNDVVAFAHAVTTPESRAQLPRLSFGDLTDRARNGSLHEVYAQIINAAAPNTNLARQANLVAGRQDRVLAAVNNNLQGHAEPAAIANLLVAVQTAGSWTPDIEAMVAGIASEPDRAARINYLLSEVYFNPGALALAAASGERPATRAELPRLAQVWQSGRGAADPIPGWEAAIPVFRAAAMIETASVPALQTQGAGRDTVVGLRWASDGDGRSAVLRRSGDDVVATLQAPNQPASPLSQVVFGFTPQTSGPAQFTDLIVSVIPEGWTVESTSGAGERSLIDAAGAPLLIDGNISMIQLTAPALAGATSLPTSFTIINPAFRPDSTSEGLQTPSSAFDGTASDVPEEPASAAFRPAPSTARSGGEPSARNGNGALPAVTNASRGLEPTLTPAVPPALAELVDSVAVAVQPLADRDGETAVATPAVLRARALDAVAANQNAPATPENGTLALRPGANGQADTVFVRVPAGWVELANSGPRWVITPEADNTYFYAPSPMEPTVVATDAAAPALSNGRSGFLGFLQNAFNLPSLLIIGSLGLLSAAEPASAAGVADAGGAGALNPAHVMLSLVGVRAAVGLTANLVNAFRATKADDQRTETTVRAPHPFVVPVPTESGRRAIRFASDQPFERAFFASATDSRERIFARTAQTLTNGETVIGQGRELRFVTLAEGPSRPTPAIQELAAALADAAAVKAPVFGTANPAAVAAVDKILDSPVAGGWARRINLAPLLANADIPEGARAELAKLGDAPTLGQVAALSGAADMKAFVYQLVLHNGEAVASTAGTMVAADTLTRISQELNAPLVLQHTHPESSSASFGDRVTAHSLYVWGTQRGVISPLPFLISNQTELTFHDDARNVLLTMSAKKEIVDVRPIDAPFQSLQIGPAVIGESDRPNLWSRLRSWITSGFQKNENLGIFPPELGGEHDRLVARAGLELAYAIHELHLSPDQIRRVWGAVADNVFSPAKESDIDRMLGDDKLAGIGLATLIHQLSAQILKAYNLGYPGPLNMAGTGHIKEAGLAADQYLSVAALPQSIDGPEADWAMREIGQALDLKLLSPDDAQRRAVVIRDRLGSASADKLTGTLLALAGLNESDFLKRLEAASTGGFTTRSDVAAVLAGKSGDAAARAAAIGILVQPVAKALATASGLKIDAATARILTGLRVELVTPGEADARVTHRSAGLLKDGENYRVQIVLEENLGAEEALATAVGRLAHELAHVLAHHAVADLSIEGLGIPTLAEEAWVGLSVSRGLRWMGLNNLSDAVELETLEAIVDMRNAQAFYVVYEDVKGNKATIAALVDQVRATKGATRVVVLTKPSDMAKATRDLGRQGLHVVSTDHLRGLAPSGKESRLETHGRLFLGTTRVRLILRKDASGGKVLDLARYAGMKDILLRAGGRPALDLVEEIATEKMAEGLKSILQRQIKAAKQA